MTIYRDRSGSVYDDGVDTSMGDTETCSWCLLEVPDDLLVEVEDGARLCRNCKAEHDGERESAR